MMQGHTHGEMMESPPQPPWWRTRSGLVLCGFLVVAGFYLITEHTAHLLGVLPYLLILACPLMHLFHHHGGGHGGRSHAQSRPAEADRDQGGRT